MSPVDTGAGTEADVLGGLIDAFDDLEERVAQVEGAGDVPADVSFDEWLTDLTATYSLEQTLRGWEDVPGLRQELEALHAAWLSAHTTNNEPRVGFGAASWHDTLARVIERADWWRARAKRRTP